jgi:TolB-like protein/Flp pilus assembly protein TadD
MGWLESFVSELRRRRVVRALLGWGLVSFAVLQVYEPVMHGLHLPEWTLSFVVVSLGLGFPVTAALAWAFDLTASGVERTPASTATPGGPPVALLLAVLAVLAAVPGLAWYLLRGRGAPADMATAAPPQPGSLAAAASVPSIAVLPFADMSQAKDQEYFSDGVAEEILNALAHVDGLRVIGRTSSFYFKGKNEELTTIARKLAVTTVLEGSVRREGNRVRVTAQLIDATSGAHLWSEAYDRELNSLFAVQEQIARAVVAALQVKLLPVRAPAARAINAEAHSLYLRGRHAYFAMNRDGYFKGQALLEQAAALDPAYAEPHAGMALTLRMMSSFADSGPAATALQRRALAEADRAVELGPELSDAYSIRGQLRFIFRHDWAGAEADLRRALALSPNDAFAMRRLGILEAELGQVETGIATLRRSTELDPLLASTWNWLGIVEAAAGRLEASRLSLARSRELAPESPEPRSSMANLELLTGHPEAALRLVPTLNEADALAVTAAAEQALGHGPASRQALDRLIARYGHTSAQVIAEVLARRGEHDEALRWLERADGQDNALLKIDPLLRPLHGDPRWNALLRKFNLPPD